MKKLKLLLDGLVILGLLSFLLFIASCYGDLPQRFPVKFDHGFHAIKYQDKSVLWWGIYLPVLLICIFLFMMNRNPGKYSNYKEGNYTKISKNTSELLGKSINVVAVWSVFLIVYYIIDSIQ